MKNITNTLTTDHRECDHLFSALEASVAGGEWAQAVAQSQRFNEALENHFAAEEQLLFPQFEAATGMSAGPTQVMRGEHQDIREQLTALRAEISNQDAIAWQGEAETLLILLQQHNMKEENILYPMCDRHLGSSALLDELSERLSRSAA